MRYALLVVCVLAVGCGSGDHSTLSGTVTLDGKALDRGTVTFHPVAGGAAAYGMIQSNGSYTIQTGRASGLAPGKYVVTVVATEAGPSGNPEMPGRLLTPAKYRDVDRSDLKFEVKPGKNQLDLLLKGA